MESCCCCFASAIKFLKLLYIMSSVQPMEMSRSGAGECDVLGNQPNLFVKQTRKGCFQECFGCDANTEFKIATLDQRDNDIYYALENTSCCIRFWCGSMRPYEINLWSGKDNTGSQLGKFVRPLRCQLGSLKCCCYQEIQAENSSGSKLGSVKERCWCCVPSFDVKDANDQQKYLLHFPTCCDGMCIDCCAEGCCNCRIPFYVFTPGKGAEKKQVGKIVKVWSGFANELFTDADKFEVQYPPDADAASKSTLLGATFLLNSLFFERQKESPA
jgi:hypothetical protein